MADELDRFVLQYIVEQRDAIRRLNELQNRVETVGKKSNDTARAVRNGVADAVGEVGKLVPGLDRASSAIRMLGTEFTLAAAGAGAVAVGLGAIALGTKAVIDMRDRYNVQRRESMEIGVSSLRLEEYQRKFVKASGGNISREQTAEEIKKLSQFSSAVFRDPTRIGQEARTARVLGIDMGKPGEHRSVNDMMKQLGDKFSKLTDAQVMGQAKTLGMNQDFALGLKRQGKGVGDITELSEAEIKNRNSAQTELDKFNKAFATLKDNFVKAENVLGEKLLPPFLRFIESMAKLTENLPKHLEKGLPVAVDTFKDVMTLGLAGDNGFLSYKKWLPGLDKNSDPKETKAKAETDKAIKAATTSAKASEKASGSLLKLVDGEYDANAEARNIADAQGLAINQFAGAVASFANAVDERQAWAAWAGEIGKASGLKGPSSVLSTPNSPLPASGYDPLFDEAASKYSSRGVTADLLKRITKVESGFNPNALSGVGAVGLMQIMPSNNKGLGITNARDPRQNIMGGAALMDDFLKRSGGDMNKALMMYHGGLDPANWGPLTRAYPGKVLGAGGDAGAGESRDKINLRSVQNTIAQRLGIPVAQLQQGRVNRGDVDFANSQLQAGITNQIYDTQNQLKAVNLPQQVRSKMMTELRNQQSGLTMMRNFGSQVEEKAQPGGRSITLGERAVVINVNGAGDPAAVGQEVKTQLDDHFGELVNGTSTGMKY